MSFLRLLPLALFPVVVACSGSDGSTETTDASSTTDSSSTSLDSATSDTSTSDTSATDTGATTSEVSTETSVDSGTSVETGTDAKVDGSGAFCGGIAGKMCPSGEYCFQATGVCLKPDAGGTCQAIPAGCSKELNPVCGCDGRDYGNPCLAAAAGASIAKTGACGTTGGSCGGKLGITCSKTQFCDYAPSAMCGATDVPGTCQPRPEACTALFDPVCGCNRMTYSNACEAHRAGVDDASTGACP